MSIQRIGTSTDTAWQELIAPSLQISYGNQRLVIHQNVLEDLPLDWIRRFERLLREAQEFVEVERGNL
jgi:hypothetical protein